MSQIFLRALRHLIDPPDKNMPREPFRVEYATQSGDLVRGTVVCTSSHFANDTFNLKFVESGQVRTVNACLLLSYNDKEVML